LTSFSLIVQLVLRLFNFVDEFPLLGANEEDIEDAADDDGNQEATTN
jgi:hypothetical protein